MARKTVLLLVVLLLSLSAVVTQPTFSSISTPDSWMAIAPMPTARGGLGLVSVNNTLYAIGGSTASGLYPSDQFGGLVGTNEAYNITTNSWTYKSPMPTPRDYFAIAAYQNKIYCIGGHIKSIIDDSTHHSQFVVSGITEVYNAETDKWETKTPMPTIGMYLQASVTNGKILVTGAGSYLYDPIAV